MLSKKQGDLQVAEVELYDGEEDEIIEQYHEKQKSVEDDADDLDERWDVPENELDAFYWAEAVRNSPDLRVATFGAGCFWGTEKFFAKDFAKRHPGSIIATAVGYMNPIPNKHRNPKYRQVCQGETGHLEVAHVIYDKTIVSYEKLVKHFFTFHDPTQSDRQENDKGPQYASAIFFHSNFQSQVAEKIIKKLQDKMYQGKIKTFKSYLVRTHLCGATQFWPAEQYHQRYLEVQPMGYCNHKIRFDWRDI